MASNSFFKIRSRESGKVLDVDHHSADANVKIRQHDDNGGINQQWQLIAVGNL